ncbi:glycosyltransferase [Mycobacterium sp. 3519A]|uniref:glycosyltransferase n=1 Tax=Mycobacterium sp. 3519A TaxID=2057184 RepID=UPI000C7CB5B9|nr:glycosyltransferase [Mycobacterium sp. 3519A]
MRAFFVLQELPIRKVAGHHLVNMAVINALLARGHKVTILLTAPRMPGPVVVNPYPHITVEGPSITSVGNVIFATRPQAIVKLAAKQIVETAPVPVQNFVGRLRTGRAPAASDILGKFDSAKQMDWAARAISAGRPDVVFLDTVFRCPVIRHIQAPRPKVVVVTHDVFHLRHSSLIDRGIRVEPTEFTCAQETALLRPADLLVAINAEDKKSLQAMLPGAAIIEASMPVYTMPRPASHPRNQRAAVFVGSDGAHNADGLQWFLAQVWPHVRAAEPEARLDVYGLVCASVSVAPAGVKLHGRVRDLTSRYHDASVAICPLKAGSGLKIKMLDYFSHGLPVVSTAQGASGLAPSARPPYVVSDDPMEFAAAMLTFMRDAQKLAAYEQRAYSYCGLYSEERMFDPLISALAQ